MLRLIAILIMETTAKTNKVTMDVPNVYIQMYDIQISKDGKRFKLKLKTSRTDYIRNAKVKEVYGKVSPALRNYLFHKREGQTNFQRFLIKNNIEPKTGVLKSMKFISHNMSESFEECPFKLIMYKSEPQLTLVNARPMKRVQDKEGNFKVKYQTFIDKEGNVRTAYYSKEAFRRLVIQAEVE